MYCTSEDGASTSMAELYIRLRKARVPTEVHFFDAGPHGTGLAQGHPVLGEWPQLMHNWLRAHAYLTGDNRVSLAGSVKVDGKPMARGYVFFQPLDNRNHPTGAAFVFNSGPTQGEFQLTKENGLVPGRYRVEVRQVAGRFTSNSIDTFLLGLQRKAREAGKLNDQDLKEWLAYAYTKDFTPTLERQRVFSKARPGDATEMTVEIKADATTRLDLELATK
jgi:hypothetical protein